MSSTEETGKVWTTDVFSVEKNPELPTSEVSPEGKSGCWSVRYTFALLAFLGLAVMFTLQVNLSITIVAMAGTAYINLTSNSSQDICPLKGNNSQSGAQIVEGEFEWDEQTQGLVLGALYYGYACTTLLGGRAADCFGGKVVFGLGTVLSSVLTLLSPLCARTSTGLFVAVRILMGLAQGVSIPAVNSMMATWFPPEEKAKFGPMVFGGMQFGMILALPLSGWLSASDFLGGWPSVFYIFGSFGALWGIPWFIFIYDRPENHPRISRAELALIRGRGDVKKAEVVAIPWKSIFTSSSVWACIFIAYGGGFGFYTLMTEMPTYLANIQHFNINANGILSALPYVCLLGIGLVWGLFMDKLYAAGYLSIRSIRRISTAMSHYTPALALLAMCFVDCDSTLAMVVLCIAVGATGCAYSGCLLSEQDIAPNLAGTIVGITNTAGAITGFVAPGIIGAITHGSQGSLSSWRWVFAASIVTYAITTTLYLFLMSSDVQPWNEPKGKRVKEENESESRH